MVAEIRELYGRGIEVIACSVRSVANDVLDDSLKKIASKTLFLSPLRMKLVARATYLCVLQASLLADFYKRIFLAGTESPLRRAKALIHTWLGVYYALLLEGRRVQHIHVHHGYFGAWIAMVAARMLRVTFSMTLHGSDLLLHRAYLDTKLENCSFCLTISGFNRSHILRHYPQTSPEKIMVQRMGVDLPRLSQTDTNQAQTSRCMILLSVGRLHRVKNHAFLIRACRELKNKGFDFLCMIAGDGPERESLARMIERFGLQERVELLGALSHEWLSSYYRIADLVILTSRSEGIPLVLMEAMAHQRTVLAPSITGIPELVEHGKTGFLYRSGSLEDFVAQVQTIWDQRSIHQELRRAARNHVVAHYDRTRNLAMFADTFMARIKATPPNRTYENSLLQ